MDTGTSHHDMLKERHLHYLLATCASQKLILHAYLDVSIVANVLLHRLQHQITCSYLPCSSPYKLHQHMLRCILSDHLALPTQAQANVYISKLPHGCPKQIIWMLFTHTTLTHFEPTLQLDFTAGNGKKPLANGCRRGMKLHYLARLKDCNILVAQHFC